MKFGVNTFLWTANFREEHFALLPEIKRRGFTGIEVAVFDPASFPAKSVRRALKESDLECTVVSVIPPGQSLLSPDHSIREATINRLRGCITSTAEAGAHILAGPLYSPVGFLPGRRRTESEWNYAVEGYSELTSVLVDCEVTLAIEPLNRFETYFLNLTADAVKLCEQVNHPNVGILWDTFHANIEEKDIGMSLLSAGKYLKHVHTCENDRGTPGSGHVDWPAVFDALRRLQYDDWLTIESFGFAIGEISAAASIWRDLAPTPESIAWEGIQFLQRNA